jgi:hypothetical protein
MDFSKQASNEPSFLLHASIGTKKDNTCVAATGPWPAGSVSQDDDNDDDVKGTSDGAYVTCYSLTQNGAITGHCWSHSYYDVWGNWQKCTPNGYGKGWAIDSPKYGTITNEYTQYTLSDVATCGGGCGDFSSGLPL